MRTRTSWEQVKEENRTSSTVSSEYQKNFAQQRITKVSTTWDKSTKLVGNDKFDFVFSLVDENWVLAEVKSQEKKYVAGSDFEAIHYSLNKTTGVWSVLIREGDRAISSFVFIPVDGKRSFVEDNSPYFFLTGKGYPTSWREKTNLEISFCNPYESKFEELSREAIDSWREVLKDRVNLSMNVKKCAPFSDVNERGIYMMDVYMVSPIKGRDVGGITIPMVDPMTGKIHDSDIFIMRSELYEKYGKGAYKSVGYVNEEGHTTLKRIISHEYGHWLGLGHNFETPSIMNYDYNSSNLTGYDKDAVQHLYPLRTPGI